MKYSNILIIGMLVALISGCGSRFESGEHVFIDLQGSSIMSSAYVEGHVLKHDGQMVTVQVDDKKQAFSDVVKTFNNVQVGREYHFPEEQVSLWLDGKGRYDERLEALKAYQDVRDRQSFLLALDRVRVVAQKQNIAELRFLVDLVQLNQKYFFKDGELVSMSDRLGLGAAYFGELKAMVSEYGHYDKLAMIVEEKALDAKDPDLFDKLVFKSVNGYKKTIQAYPSTVENVDDLIKAYDILKESSLVLANYLTNDCHYSGEGRGAKSCEEFKAAMVEDAKESTAAAAKRLIAGPLTRDLNTLDDAKKAFEKAKDQAATLSAHMDNYPIFDEKTKDTLFLNPVAAKIEGKRSALARELRSAKNGNMRWGPVSHKKIYAALGEFIAKHPDGDADILMEAKESQKESEKIMRKNAAGNFDKVKKWLSAGKKIEGSVKDGEVRLSIKLTITKHHDDGSFDGKIEYTNGRCCKYHKVFASTNVTGKIAPLWQEETAEVKVTEKEDIQRPTAEELGKQGTFTLRVGDRGADLVGKRVAGNKEQRVFLDT